MFLHSRTLSGSLLQSITSKHILQSSPLAQFAISYQSPQFALYLDSNITKKQILKKVTLLNQFYLNKLKIKPKIAVLGLNPHCETIDKYSEENKIIKPAINLLIQKKINVKGPFPADTFFLKENYKTFNLVIGMYHDQVLTPIKTIFKFDAVNITVGLPFIRLSPDHGPNEKMFLKGKSNPLSFIRTIEFFNNFK